MTEQEIHDICKKYKIKNYTINPDGSIDVSGNVELGGLNLDKIPLKFNNVSGYFNISYNYITSLEGCPKYVGESFYCFDNKLTSLEGCPKHVIQFNCSNNKITSLKGIPNYIGSWFDCENNRLTSLEHFPDEFLYYFFCDNNQLESLGGYKGNYENLLMNLNLKNKLIRKEKLKLLNIL